MTTLTKPVSRSTPAKLPHRFASKLILTLYPGAVLGIREPRRKEITFDLATLYTTTLLQEAWEKGKRTKRTPRRIER
jgi:hypothetical protein